MVWLEPVASIPGSEIGVECACWWHAHSAKSLGSFIKLEKVEVDGRAIRALRDWVKGVLSMESRCQVNMTKVCG